MELGAALPTEEPTRSEVLSQVNGRLIAWNPVTQSEAWQVKHIALWNGGVLSTAGGLVFQGNAAGKLVAYHDETGKRLWDHHVRTGIIAPPISYRVDGVQYIAVLAGQGGAAALAHGELLPPREYKNRNLILVYALGGDVPLSAPEPMPAASVPPPSTADEASIAAGRTLYFSYCAACHGDGAVAAGGIPDLRHMDSETHQSFDAIVRGGVRHEKGMAGFAQVLSQQQAASIHAYIIERANAEAGEVSK